MSLGIDETIPGEAECESEITARSDLNGDAQRTDSEEPIIEFRIALPTHRLQLAQEFFARHIDFPTLAG
jgi:hypothetical protein